MNIDFTAVKEARLGTDKIKRIYQGEKLVWNKYNWEKFDCIKESQTVAGLKKTGTSLIPLENVNGVYYGRISGYYPSWIQFADEIKVANYPLENLYNEGYRYFGVGSAYSQNTVLMYDSFQELAGIQNGVMQANVYITVNYCGLKMVMLAASYPDVLNNSPYLQECVDLTENDPEKLIGFRNWNDFDYRIDWSVRREPPGVLIAGLLTIRDRRTGEDVWNVIV